MRLYHARRFLSRCVALHMMLASCMVTALLAQNAPLPLGLCDSCAIELSGEAFVLAVEPNQNPFYHASALAHVRSTLRGAEVWEARLNAAAEVWNFSEWYGADANSRVWIKPAVALRLPFRGFVDSIWIVAGDLWRRRIGRGLTLEHAEALGANVGVHAGRFSASFTSMGVGWEGGDDLYDFSVGWDTLVGVHCIVDFYGRPFERTSSDALVLTVDVCVPVTRFVPSLRTMGSSLDSFELVGYGEWGWNAYNTQSAGMAGIRASISGSWYALAMGYEWRRYDGAFFGPRAGRPDAYFVSLTAVDKPVGSVYRILLDRESAQLGATFTSLNLNGRIWSGLLMGECSIEAVDDEFFADVKVGLGSWGSWYATIGVLNKFFVVPIFVPGRPIHGRMFRQGDVSFQSKIGIRF